MFQFHVVSFRVSTHSRPKAADICPNTALLPPYVSTHSRPKAAEQGSGRRSSVQKFQHTAARRRLIPQYVNARLYRKFQHTAARRRLMSVWDSAAIAGIVSTHSRPKAAEKCCSWRINNSIVSTHSRPKAADKYPTAQMGTRAVSTHSRPKAAESGHWFFSQDYSSFNTQPPEGG